MGPSLKHLLRRLKFSKAILASFPFMEALLRSRTHNSPADELTNYLLSCHDQETMHTARQPNHERRHKNRTIVFSGTIKIALLSATVCNPGDCQFA